MKKRYLLLVSLLTTLVGCDFNLTLSFPNLDNISTSSSEEPSSSEDIISTSEEPISSNADLPMTSFEQDNEDKTIDIYSINDFHGSTEINGNEVGILKLGTYFKELRKNENTLLINAGDMFQGSIYSNYNYGNMLTDIMNEIEFDSFTLGNHEFDWGKEKIINNRNRKSENEYQTSFLGANIYKYNIDTKEVGESADELCQKYVIKELENGLKVGIIGVIGEGLTSSVTSTYVDEFIFTNPINIVKELSDELRNEKNCDVVILSAHDDPKNIANTTIDEKVYSGEIIDNSGLTNVSNKSNKRYVDAVICAHSHLGQNFVANGVPFIQAYSNGKAYGHISLNVNSNGEVSLIESKVNSSSSINISLYDEKIESIYNSYKEETNIIANEELGTLDSTLYQSSDKDLNASKLVTTAIGSYVENVDYTICNSARSNLNEGTITYADLFKAFPFNNDVYIATVKGSDLSYFLEKDYYYMYRNDEEAFDSNKEYKVAIIDYLLLHKNSNREYNYFKNHTIIDIVKKDGKTYNYRDITADYIRNIKSIKSSDYSSSSDRYNKDNLSKSVSFK